MLTLPLRQVMIGIAALLCIVLLAYFAIGAYMGIALTEPKREAPPLNIEAEAKSQAVSVTARDGVRLAGWFYPKRDSGRAIIFAHGLNGCSLCSFEGKFDVFQSQLNEAGYNLLAFDFRGHGQSGGVHVTFGEEERWDILGAVDWLHQHGFTQIAVLGTSLG